MTRLQAAMSTLFAKIEKARIPNDPSLDRPPFLVRLWRVVRRGGHHRTNAQE